MLRIVVFGDGWGGEMVANFLQTELAMVEVIRVIDWHDGPYERKTRPEIYALARKHLATHVGRVDLIVLGGYAISLVCEDLRKCYPQQCFVGMDISYHQIQNSRHPRNQMAVLLNELLVEAGVCDEIQNNLPESTLIIPDCSGWEMLIDIGEMSAEVLYAELKPYFALCSPQESLRQSSYHHLQGYGRAHKISTPLKLQILRFLTNTACTLRPNPALATITEATFPSDHETRNTNDSSSDSVIDPDVSPDLTMELLKPDTILVLNTHFWEIEDELQDIFGASVRIIDFRQKLLHDVCLALKLRGISGDIGNGCS